MIITLAIIAMAVSVVNISGGSTSIDQGLWNFRDSGLLNDTHSLSAADKDIPGNASAASQPVSRIAVRSITSFSATPRSVIDIGGSPYEVETAGQSYSITNPAPQTLQFEIQPGDHAWFDGSNVDRAEIDGSEGGYIQPSTPVAINYQFMVQPNGPNGSFNNTASWFVTGEMHNDDTVSGVPTSPPFAIQLDGNHLQVVARYASPGVNPSNAARKLTMMTLWTDPNPIQMGQYNNISIKANVSNTSAGYLDVSVNGSQVVNYSGPLGYGSPTYWEEGLYRNSGPTQTVTANFRDLMITTGSPRLEVSPK